MKNTSDNDNSDQDNDEKKSNNNPPKSRQSGIDQETFNKLFRKKKTPKKKKEKVPVIILPPWAIIDSLHTNSDEEQEEETQPKPDSGYKSYSDHNNNDNDGDVEIQQLSAETILLNMLNRESLPLQEFLHRRFYEETKPLSEEFKLSGKPLGEWFSLSQNGLFIEFDSLLHTILSMKKDNDSANNCILPHDYGISTLHFIFTLRRYLKRIIDYGVVVRLIFFEKAPRPLANLEYTFYRKIAVNHFLILSHEMIRMYVFEYFECPSFINFIKIGIPEELISCEAIALDLNFKFARDYCHTLTTDLEIYAIHLSTITSPFGVASFVNIKIALPGCDAKETDFKDQYSSPPLTIDIKLLYISHELLCHKLDKLYASSRDMPLKSLVCSHLLCLFLQSYLPINDRIRLSSTVPDSPSPSNSAQITDYFSRFIESTKDLNNALLWSSNVPTLEKSHCGNALHICDLWDGRFLMAVHCSCMASTHRALFFALPEDSQMIIMSHFPPATFHQWNIERVAGFEEKLSLDENSARLPSYPPLIQTSITNAFQTFLRESQNTAHVAKFSDPIEITGPLYSIPFDPVHHFHSNRKIKNQLLTPAQHLRVIQFGIKNHEARKKGCQSQIGNSAFPSNSWWNYDLNENNCEMDMKGKRTTLIRSTGSLPSQYDYIDIGSELRREYMLPNDHEYSVHPEPWQLQMFQYIKERKSLVVIAPTSSGKTMSAEYAMRITARSHGNGIGVFVLPTNALVRQTYATLCNDRYIPRGSVAMFTSERRDNYDMDNFKILVTNPQCLHLLIFSKSNLFERITCVVIDEVHCIGATEGDTAGSGPVIERLLCMLQCPVICLSATLANVHQFVTWLRTLRPREDVETIEHHERSTALHYYSVGFDTGGKPIQKANSTHLLEIGQFNLKVNVETADTGTFVVSGQWLLTISQPVFDHSQFLDIISPQIMQVEMILHFSTYDDDNDQTDEELPSFCYTVKVLPTTYRSELLGSIHLDLNGNSQKEIPFAIDLTASELIFPFTFTFDKDQNKVLFAITHNRTKSQLIESSTPISNHQLLDLSSVDFIFSAKEQYYRTKGIRAVVKENHRPLPIIALLDPNAIPLISHIDLNPLSFLPRVSYWDPKLLSDFLTASPALQPHHIVETFDALKDHLNRIDDNLFKSFEIHDNINLPVELLNVYNQLAVDSFAENDPHEYAFYRSRYSSYIRKLHEIIRQQHSLFHRLVLDNMMSSIFNRANLDWYGKLYYLTVSPANFNQSPDWEQEYSQSLQILRSDPSIFVSCLCRSTSSLAFYSTINLRNTSAVDSSLKYILSLLLQPGIELEEQTTIPETLRKLIITALQDSNASRLHLLQELTPTHDKYTLTSNEIISQLRYFFDQEENPINSKEVKAPTILFHFSKKGIDKMVKAILQHPNLWFGDRLRGHFLSKEDIDRLNLFLPNQIRKFEREALMYGIGMHYKVSKENQDYLEEVEYLFQSRKLKFVFATSSLSYGINMPAANVVFVGGSPFLNGLLLRQCAGRAGRRGYGAGVGKVFFAGIGADSIVKKMCLPFDQLRPQLAISSSYLLTSSILNATCPPTDSEWIHGLITRTITQPLYQHLISSPYTRQLFDQALAHSCLFTWSFLNQRGYLQKSGLPTLKCDLQYRLHYLEPQCFVLTELLTACLDPTLQFTDKTLLDLIPDDFIDPYLDPANPLPEQREKYEELEKVILSLLNNLLSQSRTTRKIEAAKIPLHPLIKQIWNDYTATVGQMFVNYLRGAGVDVIEKFLPLGEHCDNGCDYLPIIDSCEANSQHLIDWAQQQTNCRPVPLVRSIFASLSQPHDNFQSITEMIMTIKDGLFVSDKIIPSCSYPDQVHIRVEYIYAKKKFADLRGEFQDVDAESSCEIFSKAIRCVRAFIQKLFTYSEIIPFSPKAVVLFKTIVAVINKFEKHLAIARGLGDPSFGQVVKTQGSADIRVTLLSKSPENMTLPEIIKIYDDEGEYEYELGDVISFYPLMSRGRMIYKYPAIVESLGTERECFGRVVRSCGGPYHRGEVEDSGTEEVYTFYSFQIVGESSQLNEGAPVLFTTITFEEFEKIIIVEIQLAEC